MACLQKRGQCGDNRKRVAELVAHSRQPASLAQAFDAPVLIVELCGAAEPEAATIPLLEALRAPRITATFLVISTLGRQHVEQERSGQSTRGRVRARMCRWHAG